MSRFYFVSSDVIQFGWNLTDTTGGGCGKGWNQLWNQLRTLYFATGQDANHYALMKTGIPTAYGGCGGGNVGASFVGGGSVMAQELGHGLGRAHAPGCGAGGPDPNYPHYTHPPTGTIGEYGFDYATGTVYDPSTSTDFMGYCGNQWVSPYTYRALINGINNQPSPSAPSVTNVEQLHYEEEHLYLGIRIDCNGKTELLNGFRMIGPPANPSGKETQYTVEIQDDNGKILFAKNLTLEEAHQDIHHSHTEYFDALPMYKEAKKIVFKCSHHNDPTHIEETIFEIPSEPPTLTLNTTKLNIPKPGESVKLEWTANCQPAEKMNYIIRYSNDGGKTWTPIVIGLETNHYEVEFDQLPGGTDCKLQVMASTILRSSTAETDSFTVEKKKRIAMISPIENSITKDHNHSSDKIELAGIVYSPDYGCAEEDEMNWSSSIQGHLGTGSYLAAVNLVPGEHIISFVGADGENGITRTEYRLYMYP